MTVSDERIKRLVSACREETDRFTRRLVDRACEENPSAAVELRRRYEALRAAGLVPDDGSFGAVPDPWSEAARRTLADPGATSAFAAVGPYQPLRELGRGGQAVVYLAEDLRLHRPVALKILHGLGPLTDTMLRRFRREARVASKLDHPGICAVYDAGVADGVPYIAMRFVEGDTLADRIEAAKATRESGGGPASVGSATTAGVHQVLELIEKAARALHVAHEAGVVHRDVKPGNVMVDLQGRPVILDFGLAGDEDGDLMSRSGSADASGTPAYMSPEQLMARRIRVDRRTDVYSLGVSLFECLALERPFRAPTREGMYEAIEFKSPPDIRKLNAGVSVDVKVVVETALEKDRDRRYQSAEAFADDLARVRRGEPIAGRPVSAPERAWRWAKRRPVRAALVAVLLVSVPVLTALVGRIVAGRPAILEARRQAFRARIDDLLEAGFDELHHGEPRGALAAFESALALLPDGVEAKSGKALALGRLGDYEGCLRFIERDSAGVEHDRVLRYMKCVALKRTGREGEAADLERKTKRPVSGSLDHFLVGLTLLDGDAAGLDAAEPDFRGAYGHLMTAALTAPEARRHVHLALAYAADHLDDAEEIRVVNNSMAALWPDSIVVNLRACDSLLEKDAANALMAARRAYTLALPQGASAAPNAEWLAGREECVLNGARKLLEQPGIETNTDLWLRIQRRLETLISGWKEDLSCGRRATFIKTGLETLGVAPFAAIRNPADCPGLPTEEHDRWRRLWADVEATAMRANAK
jgi:serine/threonine protein kinase